MFISISVFFSAIVCFHWNINWNNWRKQLDPKWLQVTCFHMMPHHLLLKLHLFYLLLHHLLLQLRKLSNVNKLVIFTNFSLYEWKILLIPFPSSFMNNLWSKQYCLLCYLSSLLVSYTKFIIFNYSCLWIWM